MEISSYYPVVYTPLDPAEKLVTPVSQARRTLNTAQSLTDSTVIIQQQQQMTRQIMLQQHAAARSSQFSDLSAKSRSALQAYTHAGREQEKKQLSEMLGVDEFA